MEAPVRASLPRFRTIPSPRVERELCASVILPHGLQTDRPELLDGFCFQESSLFNKWGGGPRACGVVCGSPEMWWTASGGPRPLPAGTARSVLGEAGRLPPSWSVSLCPGGARFSLLCVVRGRAQRASLPWTEAP